MEIEYYDYGFFFMNIFDLQKSLIMYSDRKKKLDLNNPPLSESNIEYVVSLCCYNYEENNVVNYCKSSASSESGFDNRECESTYQATIDGISSKYTVAEISNAAAYDLINILHIWTNYKVFVSISNDNEPKITSKKICIDFEKYHYPYGQEMEGDYCFSDDDFEKLLIVSSKYTNSYPITNMTYDGNNLAFYECIENQFYFGYNQTRITLVKEEYTYKNENESLVNLKSISVEGKSNNIYFSDIIDEKIKKESSLLMDAIIGKMEEDKPDLSGYALKSEIPDVSNFALKSDIPTLPPAPTPCIIDLSSYYTKTEIDNQHKTEKEGNRNNLLNTIIDTFGETTTSYSFYECNVYNSGGVGLFEHALKINTNCRAYRAKMKVSIQWTAGIEQFYFYVYYCGNSDYETYNEDNKFTGDYFLVFKLRENDDSIGKMLSMDKGFVIFNTGSFHNTGCMRGIEVAELKVIPTV